MLGSLNRDDEFTQQQHDQLNSIDQALTAKRVRNRAGLEAERRELRHLKLKAKNVTERRRNYQEQIASTSQDASLSPPLHRPASKNQRLITDSDEEDEVAIPCKTIYPGAHLFDIASEPSNSQKSIISDYNPNSVAVNGSSIPAAPIRVRFAPHLKQLPTPASHMIPLVPDTIHDSSFGNEEFESDDDEFELVRDRLRIGRICGL
ncbi:hypothetical protein HK100_001728 [Physocladia obscura]|uniref:Uncharacterized protein n=1 Tax=Physocladia obscura TaxID=109957 RepID=A0AAD5SZG0_9FUNG|nr:hypothetical protein HK100_001728 [Physocladia obscura]